MQCEGGVRGDGEDITRPRGHHGVEEVLQRARLDSIPSKPTPPREYSLGVFCLSFFRWTTRWFRRGKFPDGFVCYCCEIHLLGWCLKGKPKRHHPFCRGVSVYKVSSPESKGRSPWTAAKRMFQTVSARSTPGVKGLGVIAFVRNPFGGS